MKNHIPVDLHRILDYFLPNEKYETKGAERIYCCPFHKEETPSFSATKEVFNCFGCGVNGNGVTFIAQFRKIDTKEAFKHYCEIAGISYKDSYKPNIENEEYYNSLSIPEKILRSSTLLSEPTEYLKKRGISTIKSQSIYVLQKDFIDTYQKEKIKIFKNAYIIPVYIKGKLSSIQYINPNNTKMFIKGHSLKAGYAKFFVNSQEQFFLVEGVWDALSLNVVGYNAICVFNKANLVSSALDNYDDWVFKGNVFADNDREGITFGAKASNILSTKVIKSPQSDYKDVNDLLLAIGEKELKKMIVDFLEENYLSVLNSLIKRKQLKIFYNEKEKEYTLLLFNKELKHTSKKKLGAKILNKLVKEKILSVKTGNVESVAKMIGNHIVLKYDSISDVNYYPKYEYFTMYKEFDSYYLNIYKKSGLHAKKNLEKKPFPRLKEHLIHITGSYEYYEWFIKLLAWKWQKPDVKYPYIPIFHGVQGTGKSSVGTILSVLFGENTNKDVTDKDFESNFNPAFENKLFCVCDEAITAENRIEAHSKIKALTGSTTFALEDKNVRKKNNYKNYNTIILISNYDYVYPVEKEDRRAVVFKQDHRPNIDGENADKDYFIKLRKVILNENSEEFEGLAYHLSTLKLDKTLEKLETTGLQALKENSKHHIDLFVDELASNYEDAIAELNHLHKTKFPCFIEPNGTNYAYDNGFLISIDKKSKTLFISTNMFKAMINKKFSQNAKNDRFIYSSARKNEKFSYELNGNFILNVGVKSIRVVAIRLDYVAER